MVDVVQLFLQVADDEVLEHGYVVDPIEMVASSLVSQYHLGT